MTEWLRGRDPECTEGMPGKAMAAVVDAVGVPVRSAAVSQSPANGGEQRMSAWGAQRM